VSPINQEASAQENHPEQRRQTMQLVGFRLAGREYGIPITRVREIVLMGEITRVSQAPQFIRGSIRLRNTTIPILDLRLRFGLPPQEPTDETRIMILGRAGKRIGVIVDALSEVLRIAEEQIGPPPSDAAGPDQEYLAGLVRLADRPLLVLNIDQLLGDEEATPLEAASVGS